MKKRLLIFFMVTYCSISAAQDISPKTFTYKEVDGIKLELDVFMPKGAKPGDKRPMIVFIHGGGWISGKRNNMHQQSVYFAERGLLTASISYRLITKGSSDYEKEFRNCIYDAKSAVRWMKEHASEFGADSAQLILGGGSAGGYLATIAALDDEINDPLDNVSISTKAKALILLNPAFPSRKEVPQLASMIDKSTPPVISFFGDQDKVWLPGGIQFDKTLQAPGISSEFWIAKDQKHAFHNSPEWNLATLTKAHEFLAGLGFLPLEPRAAEHLPLQRQKN